MGIQPSSGPIVLLSHISTHELNGSAKDNLTHTRRRTRRNSTSDVVSQITQLVSVNEAAYPENAELLAKNEQLRADLSGGDKTLGQLTGRRGRGRRVAVMLR
jgi:hypothetical protein